MGESEPNGRLERFRIPGTWCSSSVVEKNNQKNSVPTIWIEMWPDIYGARHIVQGSQDKNSGRNKGSRACVSNALTLPVVRLDSCYQYLDPAQEHVFFFFFPPRCVAFGVDFFCMKNK